MSRSAESQAVLVQAGNGTGGIWRGVTYVQPGERSRWWWSCGSLQNDLRGSKETQGPVCDAPPIPALFKAHLN